MVNSIVSPSLMKKLIYISFVFAVILAFTSCKKEDIKPYSSADGMSNVRSNDSGINYDSSNPYMTRGGDDLTNPSGGDDDNNGNNSGGGIVDPNEDPDFNNDGGGIVDPNEDPDFDNNGGGVVDPDEDEDFNKDDGDGK